jgi:hypothetical protein
MRSLYSLNVIGRPLLGLDDKHLRKVIYGHNTVAIYFLIDVEELQFTLIHIGLHYSSTAHFYLILNDFLFRTRQD